MKSTGIVEKGTPLVSPLDTHQVEEEFYSLPTFTVVPPERKFLGKFRYDNVHTYDYNRYRSPHDSDFWIDASVLPFDFISTMGPLDGHDFHGAHDTRPDFWQMIFETKAGAIVMATDLFERGRIKCAKYWPDNEELYGAYKVKKIGEKRNGNVQIQQFEVNGHKLKHIHLLHWPDHRPLPHLSDMTIAIDESRKCSKPIVVHCSAGVGRTGTFIACSIIKEAKEKGYRVNIPKLVAFLREKGRVRSVQEIDQYHMLYEYALEGINVK